jgi:hypothetical protein
VGFNDIMKAAREQLKLDFKELIDWFPARH